jgi:type VI secretion system secreted protein Hcp
MAIPGNMWIYDDGGALIKGGCDVADGVQHEKGFHHNLSIPNIMHWQARQSTHQ